MKRNQKNPFQKSHISQCNTGLNLLNVATLIKLGLQLEAPVNDKKVSEISENEGHKTFSSLIALS